MTEGPDDSASRQGQGMLPFAASSASSSAAAPVTGELAPQVSPVLADLPPYDFRRCAAPARASAMSDLAGAFASALAGGLHEHLGTGVALDVALIESISFDDFLRSLSHPSCLSVLRFDPPGAQGCLDLSPAAVFPMIDRLLGGRAHGPGAIPARALTQIEQGLALQIIERAARALADSWGRAAPQLEVREEEFVSDPRQLRLMPGGETVTVLRLRASFAGCEGPLSLCLPEPVTDLLIGPAAEATRDNSDAAAPSAAVPSAATQQDPQALQKNILQAAVELRALLAETKLRLSDVIEMQAGDIITTDVPADGEVAVRVEGREVFHGRLGQFRGGRAIQVTRGGGGAAAATGTGAPNTGAPNTDAPDTDAGAPAVPPADGGAARP